MKKFLLILALIVAVTSSPIMAGDITPQGMSQADLVQFLTNVVTLTNELKSESNLSVGRSDAQCLTHSDTHKAAADGTQVDIGANFSYVISGVTYSKTASDTIADVSAAAQATGSSCLYLLSVDASGDVTTTKGTAVTYGTTAVYPALPAANAPFAGINVDILSDATAGFTLGTTAFNYDASATVTVYSLSTVPSGASAPGSVSTSDLSLTGL